MKQKERFGYLMFMLSGVFFLIVAVRARDWLTTAAAVVWLLGCLAFLAGDD